MDIIITKSVGFIIENVIMKYLISIFLVFNPDKKNLDVFFFNFLAMQISV